MNFPERHRFLEYLRGRGHRITSERVALFDEIFALHEHIDADRLLASMRRQGVKISRATVYRNLDLLVECNLVRKSRLGQGRFLYEHVHIGQDHDHLICSDCDRVVEFVSPGIAALQSEICRAHGYLPAHHHLQIHGLCNACGEARKRTEAVTEVACSPARGLPRAARSA